MKPVFLWSVLKVIQVQSPARTFYFVAAEASGDLLAAETIVALRALGLDAPIFATGGAELAKHAEMSGIDVAPLSVLGLWEGVRAYADVTRLAEEAAADILSSGATHVVLVDSWGFCLRVAQKVRASDPTIKLTKLIGPQVWATRAGRAKTLASAVDHLLCIHDFEVPYYAPHGLDVHVIGHPALSRAERVEGGVYRQSCGLSADAQLIAIFPGSRTSEIARVAPSLIEAGRQLVAAAPDRRVVVAPAQSVRDIFHDQFPDLPENWIFLEDETERFGAMAAADIALACSGTVTSEIAVQGTPVITGYKTGAVTWALVKHVLMKADYITLLNMAAGSMVVPELLQGSFSGQAIAGLAENLLGDAQASERQIAAQNDALAKMGYGARAAPELAAEILLGL